ncbi:hypothetical protein NWI01_08900 [Nitrobacter winogradskyi]|uniref:Uncharacterized protein n=1 Tax=Nitrobacter winogradskyi TaxID=913 RepID=A0A4Y3W910_NITWI|nr:hypothetical protein NWI01_08900 [Nitrobacter winogradskyi]
MSRQKLRLQMGDESERSGLIKERMATLLLLALLPCGQHRATPRVGEQYRAAITGFKITAPQLAAVDK